MRGKLIVFYGVNNTGKTTQAKILVDKLKAQKIKAEYIKYPIYSLKPSGDILNNYLRGGNEYDLTPRENQIINALNRTQFNPKLEEKLLEGINIVAENYISTSIAWGVASGVSQKFLTNINSHLQKEDLAFLFRGERFLNSIEKGHKHENNNKLINKVKKVYLELAQRNNWEIINANQKIEEIHKQIWNKINKFL